MAVTAVEIPRERDLLGRLAAGTAGVVGAAFLRRLVAELAGALDAEVAFVAERSEQRDGWARTIASAGEPGIELPEGSEFELAGTPCEHAYQHELLLVRRGARLRYPADTFLRRHRLDGYLAIALRAADGRAIGHMGVIAARTLDPAPSELQALRIFGARAAAELERRHHERALRSRAEEVAASRARAVQAADDERRRIGRDLHDGAQQRLVVLGQALELALRDLEADPGRAHARLAAAREQAAVASRELRELARGLHPVGLERGLPGALAALAAQSPLAFEVDALPARRLPTVVETTVWFLVSEALSNALKHAGASALRVSVVERGPTLVAEVADDGVGGACASRGTGLHGLAARVESLGGRLTVDSPPAFGTRLSATIPLGPYGSAEAAAISGAIR
jgi:signal transduction histidine kinase